MIAEIIIISLLAVSSTLAAVLAIHNVKELAGALAENSILEEHNTGLSLENARLTYRVDELTRDLEVERTNTKMLERALLDSVTESDNESAAQAAETGAASSCPLPDKPTNIISIEDCYSEAFTPDTQQHQLQCVCHTERDPKSPFLGARYYEYEGHRAYCSALSTNYTKDIGTVFEVELECGFTFNVICADYKNALDDPRKDWYGTPCRNHDHEDAVCIIELLSELPALDIDTAYHGTFTAQEVLGGLHGHGGNVKRLTKIGRKWEP